MKKRTFLILVLVLFLVWKLSSWLQSEDINIDYPSNNAPSEITGIEFPKLISIDSSTFVVPAFVGISKTYLPEGKPTRRFYQTLEDKCNTDSFWTKEKDVYIYDNYFSNTTITIQLPHIGDTIKIRMVSDTGSY